MLQGSLPDVPIPSVDVDNVEGARTVVEHLISVGHRQIACITNAALVYTAATERLEGYRAALEGAGIPTTSGWSPMPTSILPVAMPRWTA